jgi:alpha-L-fucosidase
MNDWLKVNGEAIYGSRPWDIAEEGTTEAAEGSFGDARQICVHFENIGGVVRSRE